MPHVGLDNNGDQVDDTFDPNLESYFEGSAASESKKIDQVTELFTHQVVKSSERRKELSESDKGSNPALQRIFNDLPTPEYAVRNAHRKSNGCFKGELDINPGLMKAINAQLQKYNKLDRPESPHKMVADEAELGVFAGGPHYDAIVRFSNAFPGDRSDKIADARGMAVKFLPQGTVGNQPIERLSAHDLSAATLLDVVTINFPTFFTNDPLKYMIASSWILDSARESRSRLISQIEALEAVFGQAHFSALERRLTLWANGSVIYSPLYQDYYSMVPSRLGPQGTVRAVKYTWEPVACNPESQKQFDLDGQIQWADWTKDRSYAIPPRVPSAVSDFPEVYLRGHAVDRMAKDDFCFELYVQLYRNPESTSIEDCTDLWISSGAEKEWWKESVVPDTLKWILDLHNTESRGQYLERFEQKSYAPRIPAARLRILKLSPEDRASWTGNSKTCEDLSFSPWNGNIAYHKPLGVLSRMKRRVYTGVRRKRHQINGVDDPKIERAP